MANSNEVACAAERPNSLWTNIRIIMQSSTNVITTTARTAEKAVQLVENEVDNLSAEQKLRLAETSAAREALK